MFKWIERFRRPVVVELEQINCKPGDMVLVATRHEMSKKSREAVKAALEPIALAKGVKFSVFDGVRFFVVTGAKQ